MFGGKRTQRLRFIPIDNRETHIPIFKMCEATNSSKISLRSYTEKVLSRTGEIDRNEILKCHSGGTISDCFTEGDFSDGEQDNFKVKKFNFPAAEECEEITDGWLDVTPTPESSAIYRGVPSTEEERYHASSETTYTHQTSLSRCQGHEKESDEFLTGFIWDNETIKRGFSADEARLITVGELYLMVSYFMPNYCKL